MSEKANLRRRIKAALGCLPDQVRSHASASLRRQFQALPVFRKAPVVAIFHPTGTEPDLLPLLALPNKTFLFPLCHADRSLTWHRPDRLQSWRPSGYGILEPDPAIDPPVPVSDIDLVIVPGLAFTNHGDRLGHGAGFYDRFLATLPLELATVGICFTCQIFPYLPVEAHDVRVSQVLHA